MGSIVSKHQTAFIPGRTLHENIMLMQMLIHRHTVENIPAGLLFIDFAHAYDYISQEFIIAVLEAMNFPENFIGALKLAMTGQTGQVIVNGDLTAEFEINNGGKQGDPLFPLIFITACEGLFALLEDHPDYEGIATPDPDYHFKHSGYADDTVIGLASESDMSSVESCLYMFELASGQEVKPHKSFVMWLGPVRQWFRSVYHCPMLSRDKTVRYLGVKIGPKVTQSEHWADLLNTVQSKHLDWQTRGCSIFGRTLIYNSCLASKLWFTATQVPMTKSYLQKFQVRLNQYFRQGKKVTNVKLATRELIKSLGGLGQLSTAKQLDLIKSKWVAKSLTNTAHPWGCYWRHNAFLLQTHLGLHCPPALADANWSKMRISLSAKAKVLPFVTEAYRAWHSIGLTVPVTDYTELACLPLYQNKWVPLRDPESASTPESIQPPNAQVVNLLGHLGYVRIGELFKKTYPAPTIQYRHSSQNSWRYSPLTAQEALDSLSPHLNLPATVWQDVLDTVPNWIRKIMCEGPEMLLHSDDCWGALQVDDDDPEGNIGDIYYFTKCGKPKQVDSWKLYWFVRADDGETLDLQGWSDSQDQGWPLNWRTDIVSKLRSLAVTVLDITPHILGWADEVVSPNSFLIHVSVKNRHSIEATAGGSFYSLMRKPTPPKAIPDHVKPNWSSVNHKLRRLALEPLSALNDWPVTDTDRQYHIQKKRYGPATVDWKNRFKAVHNCPFLLPKYPQLIYHIITDTLKSGKWIIRSHLPQLSGYCPCCTLPHNPNDPDPPANNKTPATVKHMFSTCLMVQDVWSEADKLGHTFWPSYSDFNYLQDITLLVHSYNPVSLYKLAERDPFI